MSWISRNIKDMIVSKKFSLTLQKTEKQARSVIYSFYFYLVFIGILLSDKLKAQQVGPWLSYSAPEWLLGTQAVESRSAGWGSGLCRSLLLMPCTKKEQKEINSVSFSLGIPLTPAPKPTAPSWSPYRSSTCNILSISYLFPHLTHGLPDSRGSLSHLSAPALAQHLAHESQMLNKCS